MSKTIQIALFSRHVLVWRKGFLQLERPVNMRFRLKAPDMRKHASSISSVLTHHRSKIPKLKRWRRLNACGLAQIKYSSDVTIDVLLRRCLHDDLLLPALEFDTDCSIHHSRQHQLCMQVLTTGCKKSIPRISRRSNGSTLASCGDGGGGGGGGGKGAALQELAGASNDVLGAG